MTVREVYEEMKAAYDAARDAGKPDVAWSLRALAISISRLEPHVEPVDLQALMRRDVDQAARMRAALAEYMNARFADELGDWKITLETEQGGVAASRWAHNPEIGGSIPPPATFSSGSWRRCEDAECDPTERHYHMSPTEGDDAGGAGGVRTVRTSCPNCGHDFRVLTEAGTVAPSPSRSSNPGEDDHGYEIKEDPTA